MENYPRWSGEKTVIRTYKKDITFDTCVDNHLMTKPPLSQTTLTSRLKRSHTRTSINPTSYISILPNLPKLPTRSPMHED